MDQVPDPTGKVMTITIMELDHLHAAKKSRSGTLSAYQKGNGRWSGG